MGVEEFIKKIPVPICGLSLGLASLDRFLRWAHGDINTFEIFALLAFIIAALFTIRILVDRKGIIKDLSAPAVFAVLPTYTMTIMLLCAYLEERFGGILGHIGFAVWIGAIVACYVIMFFFVRKFILNFSIENVYPSWVIIFVGYCVACVTCASFNMEMFGQILFWSGFIGYMCMLPPTLYRTVFHRKIPGPLVPQIAIFAAPANLCAVGCLTAYGYGVSGVPEAALLLLAAIGTISYFLVLAYLPIMLNRKFYPSFAALTFPLVISAVMFYSFGENYGLMDNEIYSMFQSVTLFIAAAVLVYVLIRYVVFLYRNSKGTSANT
jgi:exfoliative toxin A/B